MGVKSRAIEGKTPPKQGPQRYTLFVVHINGISWTYAVHNQSTVGLGVRSCVYPIRLCSQDFRCQGQGGNPKRPAFPCLWESLPRPGVAVKSRKDEVALRFDLNVDGSGGDLLGHHSCSL